MRGAMLAFLRSSGYAASVKARKATVVFIAFVAMSAFLVACSKSDQTAPPVVTTSSEPPVATSPPPMVVGDCTIEPRAQCPDALLEGAVLVGENLQGANFSGADLHAGDLRRVDLTGANLSNANLSDTDLSHAKLLGADLTRASLKHANLEGTDLTGATLRISQLNTARLCETKMPDGTTVVTGCGLPSPSTTSSESPTPSPGATVTNFTATKASVICPSSPPDAVEDVKLNFTTENADKVEFLLDGVSQRTLGGNAADKGPITLSFPCNAKQHKYTIVASGTSGTPDRASVTVYRS